MGNGQYDRKLQITNPTQNRKLEIEIRKSKFTNWKLKIQSWKSDNRNQQLEIEIWKSGISKIMNKKSKIGVPNSEYN